MKYRTEITGLRAIAVLPVIFYHAGIEVFKGGYIGVDIFFVISGYLITSIILEEKYSDFNFVSFYIRRIRRILPALYFLLLICTIAAWFILMPVDLKNYAKSLVAVSLFGSNEYFQRSSDYFETAAELKPLLHTWSLSVEEQYYFAFPFVISKIRKHFPQHITKSLFIIATTSFLLSYFLSEKHTNFAFYSLSTRSWELALGAIAAHQIKSSYTFWQYQIDNLLSFIGFILITLAVFTFNESSTQSPTFTLLPIIGTVLILMYATPLTLANRILTTRLLVGIGLMSYSAYLWHQPILAFTKYLFGRSLSSTNLIWVTIAITLSSYLSWKYIEVPLRRTKNYSNLIISSTTVFCIIFFVGIGIIGIIEKGFPSRLPTQLLLDNNEMARADNGWCFYSIDTIEHLTIGEAGTSCWLGNLNSTKKAILFGDSFAGQYEPFWNNIGIDFGIAIHSLTTNWCRPGMNKVYGGPFTSRAREQCEYNAHYLRENYSAYDLIILGGGWNTQHDQYGLNDLYNLIDYLSVRVKNIVIMPAPKQYDSNVMNLYQLSLWHKSKFDLSLISAKGDKFTEEANVQIQNYIQRFSNVMMISRSDIFSGSSQIDDMSEEGRPYTSDGMHISIYGSQEAYKNFTRTEMLKKIIRALYK